MGQSKSVTSTAVSEQLARYFNKVDTKIKPQASLQVLVHSDPLGLDFNYPAGAQADPYHSASIGKVFTATLLLLLTERGVLSLEDHICQYLSDDLLDRLFVYKGVDYAREVTVRDLVAHTSGAADYFEDPVAGGMPFMKDVVSHPDTRWTPEMLLDFSRNKQKAVGKPGTVFHYSDTGYILLGKLIEQVTGKTFHVNLHDEFFTPLAMGDSYLMFCSEPANQPKKPLQKFWLNGTEASTFTSVSCDWAGGGIVSTTADLLKFQTALRTGRLVSDKTLHSMDHCPSKFRSGIYYGLGMMEIHFEGFFFLLRGLPRVNGHIGVLSTHMFYDKASATHVIMNFGNTAQMTASFKALIEIMNRTKAAPML